MPKKQVKKTIVVKKLKGKFSDAFSDADAVADNIPIISNAIEAEMEDNNDALSGKISINSCRDRSGKGLEVTCTYDPSKTGCELSAADINTGAKDANVI
ncbi:MAG: hypothetical protein ACJAT5_000392 [Lentimonas sp.]|jgi:hypothetical protein